MRIDTLNFRVIKWCGLALKSVIARRLAVADGRKYWNRQTRRTYVRLVNKLFWSIPGSKPPGNGRRIYFLDLPSAVVVGESSVARGTEAVKLSVKLLTGLTLMALIAVAVVGLSHSASAAVDAKIFVTNKASNLTNESPAPTGRTNVSTVYGTYASTARHTVTDADVFIVTVVDQDKNVITDVASTKAANSTGTNQVGYDLKNAGNDTKVTDLVGTGFDAPGERVQVILSGSATKPIIGDVSTVTVTESGLTTAIAGVSVKSIDFAGDGTNPPIITIGIDSGSATVATGTNGFDIHYKSSDADTLDVKVTSVVDPTGATLTLLETGRNTGRFEGEVQVKERVTTFTAGTAGDASAVTPTQAKIPAVGGPISVSYVDQATSGTAINVTRSVTASLDITPPSATFAGPTNGSETQNRTPSFSGTVTDAQSGIDKSTFALFIDQRDDPANNGKDSAGANLANASGLVIVDATTINGTNANVVLNGVNDGDTSVAFSHTPSAAIPTGAPADPNHLVDFQVKVADLAGNYGYSDADTSATNTDGYLNNKPHTVKIDQKIPVISSAKTGLAYNVDTPTTDLTNVRDSIKVTFDGNVKSSSVSASDFKVTLSGSGAVFVPASIVVNGDDVYLDIDSTIPSNDKPTVSLQGTIQDLAGNSTDAGSQAATDGLAPVLTVTRSGGSGTGTGSEASDSLTKKTMTVTVSSDESLNGPPVITITNLTNGGGGAAPGANGISTGGVPQGGNVWKLTFETNVAGNHAVKVVGVDGAANTATVGNDTAKAYVVDNAVQTPVLSPAANGSTTQSNPFITASFTGDASSLSVVSATLDNVDVTSGVVASADKKTFFYQPTTALANGSHTFQLKVKDAAGNEYTVGPTGSLYKFTKSSRTDFVIELFAGWNAISIPSNPLDDSVGSVFSNSGVKQVIAYDASTPAQPWRIASKVDGSFSSQTNPGLTSVHAGHGYWVETSDFENQKVALHGPTGPGDARPALITIPTGNGWNFVGVVDQSRIQTQSADKGTSLNRPKSDGTANEVTFGEYFTSINVGRAYTFDTVASEFRSADASTDTMNIGSGIWAFISPQQNGKLPHIVP